MYAKEEKIYSAYISKHSSNREAQVIILMISNRKTMALSFNKKILALLRRITSKNNGDINFLNCLHYFRTKTKLELHKKVCENKDFCVVIIVPSQDTIILKFNQYQKLNKVPFITYADFECIIEKIDG